MSLSQETGAPAPTSVLLQSHRYLPLLANDWIQGRACCCGRCCNTHPYLRLPFLMQTQFEYLSLCILLAEVCVCVCSQVRAGMRERQQGSMFASVRFVCVCAGSWRASMCSLHDSSKRSRVRPSEKSVVLPSPNSFILSAWNNSRQGIKPR